jgi:hypothetical protein
MRSARLAPFFLGLLLATMACGHAFAQGVTGIVRVNQSDASPTTVCIGNEGALTVLALKGQTQFIKTVQWRGHCDDPSGSCSKEVMLGTGLTQNIMLTSLGTATVYADVTYNPGPGIPAPPDNTVSVAFTVNPPNGIEILPFDATQEYNFMMPMNSFDMKIQLKYNGQNCGGYNITPKETIYYTIPAPPHWEAGGNWIGNPAFLFINVGSGLITDKKACTSDAWPTAKLGEVLFSYQQTIGIRTVDWCGNTTDTAVGTLTFTTKRSPDNYDKWRGDATTP